MSGGTGQTALTVVGQVVGAYFGGAYGAAIGGMVGSYVGGELWPMQLEGPKLEGLQVSTSTYGGPIPDIYGGVRIGGNIFWASAIRETSNTEREGKGGGPEVTSYTYSVDMAIAFCAGPIIGLRKIWADQVLIFDLGDSADLGAIYASYDRGGKGMRFYRGTTTQLPDPTIEAALGVGSTPAYRDVAYAMFVDFQLADYGNRVPNFTFEVVSGPIAATARQVFGLTHTFTAVDPGGNHMRLAGVEGQLTVIAEGATRRTWITGTQGTGTVVANYADVPMWPANATDDSLGFESLLFWALPTAQQEAEGADGGAEIYVFQMPPTSSTAHIALTDIGSASYTDGVSSRTGGNPYQTGFTDGGNYIVSIVPCADREHVIAFLALPNLGTPAPSYWVMWRYDNENLTFTEVRRGTCSGFPGSADRAAGAMRSYNGVQAFRSGMMESDLEHIWFFGIDGIRVGEISAAGVATLLYETNAFTPTLSAVDATFSIFADNACAWVENDGKLWGFTRSPAYDSTITLASVVSDICVKAGLTTSDIDVTDLASTLVRGFLRSPRMSARAAIEPLMVAYAFDGVESDLKIKFRLRNATSVVTVAADDLGASESIDETIELVDSERVQESELPQSIDISYMAVRTDYQIGTQLAKRIATESIDQQSIRLPVALEDSAAAAIAARMLYEIWIARHLRKWSTTVKYAKYEPTDVVSVVGESATYKTRVIDKKERGSLIEWSGIDVDAAAFVPTSTAQLVPESTQTVSLPVATNAFGADLPPLRESDFGTTGYYAGAAGYQAGWPGAVIFRKPDGGKYLAEIDITTAATMGNAVGALAAWGDVVDGGYAFRGLYPDLIHTLDVNIPSGSLASVSHDSFLALTQTALVGNEVIAYRDAVLVSGTTYRISCLLRGLLGTEWFAALPPATYDAISVTNTDGTISTHDIATVEGHRAGDRFVKLSTTVKRYYPASQTASIQGVIKGVTSGSSLGFAPAKALPQTWASIVPPHPVQMQAYKSGSTSLTVDFDPRTFVGGGWDSSREVLLDPVHKEYIVHIENPTTPTIEAQFVVSGTPPFVINDAGITTVLNGGTNLWVMAAATPRQYPGTGALAILGNPATSRRHWSRQLAVSWV